MKYTPIKIYRQLLYRKGHGVHSPFAYDFITNVIEEKSPFYVFEDIEKCRRSLLNNKETVEFVSSKGVAKKKTIAKITEKEAHSQKYGALLFRLVNYLQCESVLQVGASTGVMSLYLATPRKENKCTVLEDRETLIPIIKDQCKQLQLNNVDVKPGVYLETLDKVLEEQDYFDMIFLNTARDPQLIQEILDKRIKTKLMVVDNIRKNKQMKSVWKSVTNNPNAKITIDLYYLGIALFEEKFYKKNYKAHFDNGKKHTSQQSLYKKGRQRLNFFNWRKKNL